MSFFGLGGTRRNRSRWRGWEDFSPNPPDPAASQAGDPGPGDADDGDDDFGYSASGGRGRGWGGPAFGGGRGFGGLELHHRNFTKRIETGEEARLRIENRNGRIVVRRHDEPVVIIDVDAEIYAANQQDADAEAQRIERGISADGNRVNVVVPELSRPEWFFFGRGPRVDYEVRVPANTDVWAVNRNGSVSITGTRGRARVEGRNGRTTIQDIGGDVDIETRNGRLNIDRCEGAVKISSLNGPITVGRVRGAIEVDTKNGPVQVNEPGAGVNVKTSNGPIRVNGKVNGDYELQASNGSVHVAVTADSRFEIDAESIRGSTRSDLPVRDRKPVEGSGPAPKVRIRTSNGSIRLTEA
ncbi:MAG TPA: DUF4097 family beta strand repeat-containing protein [Dehalococcoidia bacterium]|jgi:hypothetical protein